MTGSNNGQSELSSERVDSGSRASRRRAFCAGWDAAKTAQEASGRYFKGPNETPEEVVDAFLELEEAEARD